VSNPTPEAVELADRLLDTWMHECAFCAGIPSADTCTCREEQGKMIARMVDAFAESNRARGEAR